MFKIIKNQTVKQNISKFLQSMLLLLFLFISTELSAQEQNKKDVVKTHSTNDIDIDSNWLNTDIEEIVVTATKNEKNINQTTVPIQQITPKIIKASGSIKLADILQEQTGIQLANFLGTGVQLQGFAPEFTLILINGEPIIGKTAGVVDLSRIIVSNIKKIEIIKGPVSSLYGSDAMGGVINIITEDISRIKNNSLDFSFQYKSPIQIASNLNSRFNKNKLSFENNISYNFSNGYQTDKTTLYKEGIPFHDFTLNNKLTYRASHKIHVGIGMKYYFSKSKNKEDSTTEGSIKGIAEQVDKTNEISASPFLKLMHKNIVFNLRSYNSFYKHKNNYTGDFADKYLYDDNYTQLYNKLEAQLDYSKKSHSFTAGVGGFFNLIDTKRNIKKINQHQEYIFLQYQYEYKNKFIINAGTRTDFPSDYAIQWISPKLSMRYNANKYFYIKLSAGRGYKAPDVRQQYLNFTNNIVGYSVFGADVATAKINELDTLGIIANILIPTDKIKALKAEKSWAFNAEVGINPIPGKMNLSINYFRNEIENLIDVMAIAAKKNNSLIYTYFNIDKIYTQGIETNFSYTIFKGFTLSAGYQYLEAKDYSVLAKIKEGKIIRRDPITYEETRLTKKEYGGLFDRSKHSFNVKIFYENEKYDFSTYLRIIYRGKYGWADKNNNQILDIASEYAPGYALVNFSFQKQFKKKYSLQFGLDNLTNKKLPMYVPSLNGITAYIGCTINFINK